MDYAQIYEYEFGVKFTKRSGVNWQGRCPLPSHDDSNASFSIQIETGQCQCFGCGFKGNAITMAKALNHNNPYKFIENNENGHIRRDRPLKSDNRKPTMTIEEVEKMKEKFYDNLSEKEKRKSDARGKDFGRTNDGRLAFFYPTAIKVHKCPKTDKSPYWIGIDKHCQIYGLNSADLTKPITIIEGEKDCVNLCGMINEISFSHGAGKVPDDLSVLKDVPKVVVLGDNDDAGREHNEIVAHQFYLMGIPVEIGIWDENLPISFDPSDDIKKHKSIVHTSEAIGNAVSYVPPTDSEESTKAEQSKVKRKGFQIMDSSKYIEKFRDSNNTPIMKHLVGEQNITLVAGDVDAGKTWVGLHMGLSIANGVPFFGFKVKEPRDVIAFQFELSNAEYAERLEKLKELYGDTPNFKPIVIEEDSEIFVDAWDDIEQTIIDNDFTNGVIIVDNIYTSTDRDVSKNSELQEVMRKCKRIVNKYKCSVILIAHNNKNKSDTLKILEMDIIQGGRTLTANVNYILQIGKSTYNTDLKRGKITKTRGGHYVMKDVPFMIHFDPDTGMLEKGAVIVNEASHCVEFNKRWEIEIIQDFALYANDSEFTKADFWNHISTHQGWEDTKSNSTKVSRLLKTLLEWQVLKHPNPKKPYNSYQVDLGVLASLTNEER